MRIAIEAQRIFRKKKHGMDIVTLELIRHLQDIDHVNEYYILVKPGEDNQVLSETDNFHIIEIPTAPYPVWEQFYLPRAIRKIAPDLLHCTSNTAPLNVKVPLVLTLHDILYIQKIHYVKGTWYQRLGNLYRRWIVPKIISRCKKIITVSDFEKKEIDQYFSLPPGRVRTIHNGYSQKYNDISDEEKLQIFKKKYQLPDQYILYLGNTDPKKNIGNVLRAFGLFHRNNLQKIPLVIPDVNKRFLNNVLREINYPELSAFIHLTGYIPNDELVYIYNLASVFLYPSFYESFGIPLLEAMACGIPVITSLTAAMPEVAGGSAKLINPNNPEEISRAITDILNNSDKYLELKAKGLKRVSDFSWSKTARSTLAVYEEILSNSTQSARKAIFP